MGGKLPPRGVKGRTIGTISNWPFRILPYAWNSLIK
jgi:hypothetical protein